MISISNKIKNYNDLIYDTRPVQVSEYLSDKYNIVHKQLFNNAVETYLKTNNIDNGVFYQNNKVIELKNDEYWKPSKLIILSREYENGFTKTVVDLTLYWNTELSFQNKRLDEICAELERKFNVHINIENKKLTKEVFTCHFKNTVTIDQIFVLLKETRNINYKIKNNEITIF